MGSVILSLRYPMMDVFEKNPFGLYFSGGNLILVAARPAIGMTAFLVQACFDAIAEKQAPALYFSFHMGASHLRKLLLCHQLRQKGMDTPALSSIISLPEVPVLIDDTPSMTLGGLIMRIIHYARERDVRFFVVDNLQFIDSSDQASRNAEDRGDNALRLLKDIAMTLGVTILVSSLLTRHSQKGAELPTVRDILDVSAADDICDQIVLLHKSSIWPRESQLKVIIVGGGEYGRGDLVVDADWDINGVHIRLSP